MRLQRDNPGENIDSRDLWIGDLESNAFDQGLAFDDGKIILARDLVMVDELVLFLCDLKLACKTEGEVKSGADL